MCVSGGLNWYITRLSLQSELGTFESSDYAVVHTLFQVSPMTDVVNRFNHRSDALLISLDELLGGLFELDGLAN